MLPRPKRTGIMLAEPFSERRLLNQGRYHVKWSPPYILQPKLNGERCRMLVSNGRCLLLSSTEEIISSVPHINAVGLNLPEGEYDGELYVHGWTFSEIHSVISTTSKVHERAEEMQLHLFDLINEEDQMSRILALTSRIPNAFNQFPIKLVPFHVSDTLEDIYGHYEQFISWGYEGFIIRNMDAPYIRKRTGAMMKFKGAKKDCYIITDVIEAISESGTPKGMLGAFQCTDDMGTIFKVGAGRLTHQERIDIFQQFKNSPTTIKGNYLEVEYQTMSDNKRVPLFSRALKIVTEDTSND